MVWQQKGVFICKNKHQVIKSTSEIFKGKFISSNQVILEEFLDGEEAGYFVIVDKITLNFWKAQDHKRVFENDKGPILEEWGLFTSTNYK